MNKGPEEVSLACRFFLHGLNWTEGETSFLYSDGLSRAEWVCFGGFDAQCHKVGIALVREEPNIPWGKVNLR